MATVKIGDPTVYANEGETLEQACEAVVTRRLHFLHFQGKKVRVKDGETAEGWPRWAGEEGRSDGRPPRVAGKILEAFVWFALGAK